MLAPCALAPAAPHATRTTRTSSQSVRPLPASVSVKSTPASGAGAVDATGPCSVKVPVSVAYLFPQPGCTLKAGRKVSKIVL